MNTYMGREIVEVTMESLDRGGWIATAAAAEEKRHELMKEDKWMKLVFTESDYRFNNGNVWDVVNYLHRSHRPLAVADFAVIRREGYEMVVKSRNDHAEIGQYTKIAA